MNRKIVWLIVGVVSLSLVAILEYLYTSQTEWVYRLPDSTWLLLLVTILPISLLLIFLDDLVFHVWQKFALWYLPLAFGLIVLTSFADSGGGFGADIGVIPDTEAASWFASGLFLVISLFIIVTKSLKLRRT